MSESKRHSEQAAAAIENALNWLSNEDPDSPVIREAVDDARDALAGLLEQLETVTRERDEERDRFHRHVETMIEPKLLTRAEELQEQLEAARKALRRIVPLAPTGAANVHENHERQEAHREVIAALGLPEPDGEFVMSDYWLRLDEQDSFPAEKP